MSPALYAEPWLSQHQGRIGGVNLFDVTTEIERFGGVELPTPEIELYKMRTGTGRWVFKVSPWFGEDCERKVAMVLRSVKLELGIQLGQEQLLFNSPVVLSVTADEVDSSSDSVAAARFGPGRSSLGLPGPPLGAAASLSLEGPGDPLARRFLPRTVSDQLMGSSFSSAAGASAGLVPGRTGRRGRRRLGGSRKGEGLG
ncbi:hypothetical protein MRX96_045836 [Rhipicephalus microplus]